MLHALFRVTVSRIHNSCCMRAVDKALLSKLRKKTGISFLNCKKALEQFDNDIIKAEKWLRDQAEKEGWTKASKLENRPMSQGLIGLMTDKNSAAMIEVNCETDFVARNKKFQKLVSEATAACAQHGQKSGHNKLFLDKEVLKTITAEDGKSLSDLLALEIGNIGENMQLRRAVFLKVDEPLMLGSYVHSAGSPLLKDGTCQFGKYGALVSFRQMKSSEDHLSPTQLGQQLGQHIVGMNPKSLGTMEESDSSSDDETTSSDSEDSGDDESSKKDVEETRLLQQEFLLEPNIKVHDFLAMNSATVEDFVRFECGEVLDQDGSA